MTHLRKHLIALAAFWLTGTAALAQAPANQRFAFDLEQCIQYALQYNELVKNAQLESRIAGENIRETRAIGLPQVNGSFNLQYNPVIARQAFVVNDVPQVFQLGTEWNADASVSFNQLLFDGSYLIALRAAKALQELSQRELERTEVQTAAGVAKAYYQVLVLERNQGILENNIEQLEAVLKDTRLAQENGYAEQVEVNRIQVSLNNAETELENARNLRDVALATLKFQMGMRQDVDLELTESLEEAETTLNVAEQSATTDPAQRIEYQALQAQIGLYEYDVLRYKREYLPKVSLFASAGTQTFRTEFDFFNNAPWFAFAGIGIGVQVPIFDGLRKDALIKRAQLQVEQLNNDLSLLERNINLEQTTAETNLNNALRRLDIQERNIELAQEVYRVQQLKYREGVGSNIELVEAETALKNSQNNYLSALLEAYLARIDWLEAQGKLWPLAD